MITGADTTPLAILHKMAAQEKELPIVDCNGRDQIGNFTVLVFDTCIFVN